MSKYLLISINTNDNEYIIDNYLNTYYFYIREPNLITDYLYFFNKYNFIFNDSLLNNKLNPSYTKIYEDFVNLPYNNIDYNRIINIFVCIFKIFNSKSLITETYINTNINFNEYANIKNKLIIRTGVIELNAVYYTLNSNIELVKKSIKNILVNYDNEEYFYNNKPYTCWITRHFTENNVETSIKKLITNAGFYFNKDLSVDKNYINLLNFCNLYVNAILKDNVIPFWSFLNCFMLDILNKKKELNKINHIKIPDYNNYLSLFDNKSILLLTPFKEKIDKVYNSGNIYKLNKNKNFENIKLYTIDAFITTYPNRKHNDFFETLDYYKNEIDNFLKLNKIDIFTCSVGCYGIILCDYVHSKYNITSFYNGHSINDLFGILSNRCCVNDNFNFDLFEKSDLNLRYKNIEKIENNCYGT